MKKLSLVIAISLLICLQVAPAWAAVAFDASSESHTGATGSASEASFTWNNTPIGTLKGMLIYTCGASAATNVVTSVTYGGTNVPAVTGGATADTAGEPGNLKAWFLGSVIPTGVQAVVVNRTNNADIYYASAIGVTADSDTAVHEAGIVLLQENQNFGEQNVTDGSPGSNSVRFAGAYTGQDTMTNFNVGANTTEDHWIDLGLNGCKMARETVAGQGSRPVGFSNASNEDLALVHLAIKETSPAASTCRGALMLMGVGGC